MVTPMDDGKTLHMKDLPEDEITKGKMLGADRDSDWAVTVRRHRQ